MINVSIVGLVGKYWNVFVDSNTGEILPSCEFNTDGQDLHEPHQYSHLPDYLNQLLDRLTAEEVIRQIKRRRWLVRTSGRVSDGVIQALESFQSYECQ